MIRLLLPLLLFTSPVALAEGAHLHAEVGLSATAASAAPTPTPPAPLPDIEENPTAVFSIVYDMVMNGDWWGAAGIALFAGMTLLVRRRGERWPWLKTPWGYALSTLVLGFLGGCANALFAGQEPSWAMALTALKVALSALLAKGMLVAYGIVHPKPEAPPTAPPGQGAS